MTEQIIKMYNEDSMSVTAISKELNIDRRKIERIILESGYKLERKTRADADRTGRSQYNKKFYNYEQSAKKRGYSFELTREQFEDRVSGNCVYCGQEPDMKFTNSPDRKNAQYITINSIDRVNNEIGYTYENTVSCCQLCNRMKSDLSYEVFLSQIEKIQNYKSK